MRPEHNAAAWQHTASSNHMCDAFHHWLTVKVGATEMKSSPTRRLLWHQVFMRDRWMIVPDLCQMATATLLTESMQGETLAVPHPTGGCRDCRTSPLSLNTSYTSLQLAKTNAHYFNSPVIKPCFHDGFIVQLLLKTSLKRDADSTSWSFAVSDISVTNWSLQQVMSACMLFLSRFDNFP